MVSVTTNENIRPTGTVQQNCPQLTSRFMWAYTLATIWLVTGAHIDSWAHNSLSESLETFFTPWHGILYSGFGVTGLLLFGALVRNRMEGYTLKNSLPDGILVGFAGSIIFTLGGVGDMFWHEVFGIEANIQALYSPTHLLLGIGGTFMASALLLNYMHRPADFQKLSLLEQLPVAISAALALSMLVFFTQFAIPAHVLSAGGKPFFTFGASTIAVQGIGVTGSIIYSAFIVGLVLKLNRTLDFKFGAFAIIFFISGIYSTMMRFPLSVGEIPASEGEIVTRFLIPVVALVVGLYVDIVRARVPSTWQDQLLALTVAVCYFVLFFTLVGIFMGLAWSVHLWTGIIVLSAITGELVLIVSS